MIMGPNNPAPRSREVKKSRFEDYAEGHDEPKHDFHEQLDGSLEGTSSESSYDKPKMTSEVTGDLTPFQKELAGRAPLVSIEGPITEFVNTVSGVDTFAKWIEEPLESFEGGGIEAQMQYMAGVGEPNHVNLVGGITMKDMADAIVWSEIMGKPLARRRMSKYNRRGTY
jgi:hypothetical protein